MHEENVAVLTCGSYGRDTIFVTTVTIPLLGLYYTHIYEFLQFNAYEDNLAGFMYCTATLYSTLIIIKSSEYSYTHHK